MVHRSRLLRTAARATSLGALALVFGACQSRRVDHTAEVASLVEASKPPESKIYGFQPVSDRERSGLPVTEPAPYRLGVGDVVEVKVLLPSTVAGLEGAISGPVKQDGNLYIPVARKIEALDKTTSEVEEAIIDRLKDYVSSPLVSVEVTSYRARTCRVVGEGVTEEQYLVVDGRLTLLGALIRAGATKNERADRQEAYLIRDRKVHPFSIAAMVAQGDPSGDFVLQEGDHVVVPSMRERKDFVYVFGQVAHAGRFDMDHERRVGSPGRMTLMGAIGLAGGLNEATVDCNRICIFRGGWQDVQVFQLGVGDLFQHGESIALQPGDRVFVATSDVAKFNMGLNQFLPFISGASSAANLILTGAALKNLAK